MKMMRILIPIVGVLMAGAAGGIFAGKVLGSSKHDPKGKTSHTEAKEHEVKATHELSEFIVNLADKNPPHFAKLTIALGLNEAIHNEEEWKKHEPPVRDAVLELLTAKTYDELLTAEGKAKLKRQILQRVQVIMGAEKVGEIYFTNFAMQ